MTLLLAIAPALALRAGHAPAGPVVLVDRDNVDVSVSCTIRIADQPIPDDDGNGVVHIVGDGIEVLFDPSTPLRGAPDGRDPDTFAGVGVRVLGRDVALSGLRVRGFKAGLHATGADGLTIRECDVSGNFRQRLRSTPRAEDGADWLWPHANDDNEWLSEYGAGIWVEDSTGVTIHGVRARRGQNGIVLDRVDDSRLYDNDCSFLSGWGLALWRSSRNIVSRNAFDFCIRGYSHGVYSRGQDSAGILVFEQCTDNVFVENSATHGGDGFFGFAGREALGEAGPHDDLAWYERRGSNDNLIAGNDFSDAAAHGIEMTFGFGNRLIANRLVGNAICGVWAGYCQDTRIEHNTIEENGAAGSALERGGVNIEHGLRNRIRHNRFRDNACGVCLWWDPDEHLMTLPWARANHERSLENFVEGNTFDGDRVAIDLRATGGVTHAGGNSMPNVEREIATEGESPVAFDAPPADPGPGHATAALGTTRPVGARGDLRGRAHIVMTEWGPYDWAEPIFVCDGEDVDEARRPFLAYRLIGPRADPRPTTSEPPWEAVHDEGVEASLAPAPAGGGVIATMRVTARRPGAHPVTVRYARDDGTMQSDTRVLLWTEWTIRHFASPVDPREDVERWRAAENAPATRVTRSARLDERYGNAGPGADLPADGFGTIATARVLLPAGRWRVRTVSDDGIRLWLDEALVVDDWTWHGPRRHDHEWALDQARPVTLRVEHFELDGHSVLSVELENVDR